MGPRSGLQADFGKRRIVAVTLGFLGSFMRNGGPACSLRRLSIMD